MKCKVDKLIIEYCKRLGVHPPELVDIPDEEYQRALANVEAQFSKKPRGEQRAHAIARWLSKKKQVPLPPIPAARKQDGVELVSLMAPIVKRTVDELAQKQEASIKQMEETLAPTLQRTVDDLSVKQEAILRDSVNALGPIVQRAVDDLAKNQEGSIQRMADGLAKEHEATLQRTVGVLAGQQESILQGTVEELAKEQGGVLGSLKEMMGGLEGSITSSLRGIGDKFKESVSQIVTQQFRKTTEARSEESLRVVKWLKIVAALLALQFGLMVWTAAAQVDLLTLRDSSGTAIGNCFVCSLKEGSGLTITKSGNTYTFAVAGGSGITILNTLAGATQAFATGTSGTDFGISSSGTTHTFNLPSSSAANRGLLTSANWTTFNSKVATTRTISTTSPLGGGGDLSANRTLTCVTCVTSAASLTSNAVVIGGGSQASSTISASTTTTEALFATAGAPAFRALVDGDVPNTITISSYLLLAGGTLTGLLTTDNLGVELTDSDTNPTCAAGNYNIFADLSETTLKGCKNGTANEIVTADQLVAVPVTVANGGTGATTLTDGGLLLGSGVGVVTVLGVATNGQIPIGDGATDPVLANITVEAGGEISVTNGAGSIELDVVEANLTLSAQGGAITAGQCVTALTTAQGCSELATTAETDAGADAARVVTPEALNDGLHGIVNIQMVIFDFTTDTATGDGKFYFMVPDTLDTMDLIGIDAQVVTAGTTGTTNVDLAKCAIVATGNMCSGTVEDMLSTNLTIDTGENSSRTAAAAAVIATLIDDLATDEVIRVDVDAVHTTAAKGLILNLQARVP